MITTLLRRSLLPVFQKINPGDITIRHPYSKDRIKLHSFRHKGYWWHGAKREASTMQAFKHWIKPGDTVLEVGGHIGYISMWFAHLVGTQGDVTVFEPGNNNLPYIRWNIRNHPNIHLIEKAAGEKNCSMKMYTEDLTGQNNSLVPNFSALERNGKNALPISVVPIEVDVISLDTWMQTQTKLPSLIKIDVEGFEYEVLNGARSLLKSVRPIVMVEVQSHQIEIFKFFSELNYVLSLANGRRVKKPEDFCLNTFCVPEERFEAEKMCSFPRKQNIAPAA